MNIKAGGEVKKFKARRKIPLFTNSGKSAFLPAGAEAWIGRSEEGNLLLFVQALSGMYRMEEKYLAFCKEVKQ